jgi:hypothetical protein
MPASPHLNEAVDKFVANRNSSVKLGSRVLRIRGLPVAWCDITRILFLHSLHFGRPGVMNLDFMMDGTSLACISIYSILQYDIGLEHKPAQGK